MPVQTIADIRIWPISLEQIEATVADYLGPGRVKSKSTPLRCSVGTVSMYLARHVGGWSCPKIGRFYNRRNHTTVMATVRKLERLRASDESVDALIEMLTAALHPDCDHLRANISETFLTAQNREQGEKEMNHDRRPEVWFGGDGITGPGSNTEGEAADFQSAL